MNWCFKLGLGGSLTENPEELATDLIANFAFKEMDKDKDGWITSKEFCAAILSQDKFSKFLAVQVIDMIT